MKNLPIHIRNYLARAQSGVDSLSPEEREAHYRALVELLPEDTEESQVASHVLAMVRAANAAQSDFLQILSK